MENHLKYFEDMYLSILNKMAELEKEFPFDKYGHETDEKINMTRLLLASFQIKKIISTIKYGHPFGVDYKNFRDNSK